LGNYNIIFLNFELL